MTLLGLSRPPHRHGDGDDDRGDAAGSGDVGAFDEDVARIGVVGEPPPEEGWWLVDRPAEEFEPRVPELRLEAEPPGDPFRRRPDEGEHDGADEEHLAPEDLGRVHGGGRSAGIGRRSSSPYLRQENSRPLSAANRRSRLTTRGTVRRPCAKRSELAEEGTRFAAWVIGAAVSVKFE